MKDYLLSRLAERSTWAGLIAVLGAFGVWSATPEQASAITALALAVMGGFSAAAPDRMRRELPSPPGDRLAALYDELEKPVRSVHPDER